MQGMCPISFTPLADLDPYEARSYSIRGHGTAFGVGVAMGVAGLIVACGPAPSAGQGVVSPTADTLAGHWIAGPSLPRPLTNNAVAALNFEGHAYLFSFLGLNSTKLYSGIVREGYQLDLATGEWNGVAPVPGSEGRIAATAQGLGGLVYLFGGYTVDARGEEVSLPNVDIYDPATDNWTVGAPMPVPVDDAVSGVWRDSLIYLVSGWSQNDNVSNVQFYDPTADRWVQATPIPGPPVFGHAGAIVDDAIIYCDGVVVNRAERPPFRLTDRCYRGEINRADPTTIHWTAIPPHPGPAKYRAAAGAMDDAGLVVFAGGSGNPYNFDGIGYDGELSEPDHRTLAYDPRGSRWILGPAKPVPSMDHRGLVGVGGELWSIGGMFGGQRVTASVDRLDLRDVPGSGENPHRSDHKERVKPVSQSGAQ